MMSRHFRLRSELSRAIAKNYHMPKISFLCLAFRFEIMSNCLSKWHFYILKVLCGISVLIFLAGFNSHFYLPYFRSYSYLNYYCRPFSNIKLPLNPATPQMYFDKSLIKKILHHVLIKIPQSING